MFEGVIMLCYLVVAQPDQPETCIERHSMRGYATREICDAAAEATKNQFTVMSRSYGHTITKIDHECAKPGEKET